MTNTITTKQQPTYNKSLDNKSLLSKKKRDESSIAHIIQQIYQKIYHIDASLS